MPLYVYECAECEIELEELRPVWQADDPIECPICHEFCRRVASTFHVQRAAEPLYATPAHGTRVAHGLDCPCCRPRRRS